MIVVERLVVGAFGVVGTAERLEGAALVVGDRGIAGLQPRGALERIDRRGVLAEMDQAAGVG